MKISLATILMTGILTTFSAGAVAQVQGAHRGRVYTKADVERIIKRVEERSDAFRKIVDQSLDRSALNGTKREDSMNEQVKDLEKALDHLRSEFDRSQRWLETRSQVKEVLQQSDEINALIRRFPLRPAIEAEWILLRKDLNTLAGIYNLPLLKA